MLTESEIIELKRAERKKSTDAHTKWADKQKRPQRNSLRFNETSSTMPANERTRVERTTGGKKMGISSFEERFESHSSVAFRLAISQQASCILLLGTRASSGMRLSASGDDSSITIFNSPCPGNGNDGEKRETR